LAKTLNAAAINVGAPKPKGARAKNGKKPKQ